MTQKCPTLSKRFDLDDIRKVREYDSLRYWEMTDEEIEADIDKDADKMQRAVECYREMNKILAEDNEEEKDPAFPILSPRFDMDDIRRLREYDSLRYAKMTDAQILAEVEKYASKVRRAIECMRKIKKILADTDDAASESDALATAAEASPAPEPAPEEQAV